MKKIKFMTLTGWLVGLAILLSACSGLMPSTRGGQTANDPPSSSTLPGSISGWVWHDACASGLDGQPAPAETPAGCVKGASAIGDYHANGTMEADEKPIAGVTVRLGQDACPSAGLEQAVTIDTDLSYSFTGLKAGTYCVSIDPFENANQDVLLPGVWTSPQVQEGKIGTTVTLVPGENKLDINFGWDHQFRPDNELQGAGQRFVYKNVSFELDPAFASAASGQTIAQSPPAPDGPYWMLNPENISIALDGYPLSGTLLKPVVAVFPVAEFRKISAPASQTLDSLIDVLARKPADEQEMPFLPIMNAAQVFHSNVRYLDFKNGNGVRYLAELAQYLAPVNNEDLFYTYQGLTADGKYFVSIIMPASHPSLPSSSTALSDSEKQALANDPTYYGRVAAAFSTNPDNSFTPDLAKLDAMVASLEIGQ